MVSTLQSRPSLDPGASLSDLEGRDPLRGAFKRRALRAVDRLSMQLGEASLQEAVGSSSDFGVLLTALESEPALAVLSEEDPFAQARLRGLQAKNHLLSAEGGALRAQEVAELLHLSRQAVHKRFRAGKLLAIDCGRHGYAFPVWQFAEDGLLAGLEETLVDLGDLDPWMKLSFFLGENAALDGATPLQALRRGDLSATRRAARLHGETGAV